MNQILVPFILIGLISSLDYLWVADELCEVKLEISNPFPFELEVSNMVRVVCIMKFYSVVNINAFCEEYTFCFFEVEKTFNALES